MILSFFLLVGGVLFFPLLVLFFVFSVAFKIMLGLAYAVFALGKWALIGAAVLLFVLFKGFAFLTVLALLAAGLWLVGALVAPRRHPRSPSVYRSDPMGPLGGTLSRMEARVEHLEALLRRRAY